MKRQGERSDLTSSPVETKLRSSEVIAQSSGDSRAQVDRYIRLTQLIQPYTKIDYIIAVPRMAEYERISAQIYGIYLHYVAPEDIHVYSIDECFIDCTAYLHAYERKDHITKAEKALLRNAARNFQSGHIAVGIDPLGLADYGVEIHLDDLSKKEILSYIDEVNFNTKT